MVTMCLVHGAMARPMGTSLLGLLEAGAYCFVSAAAGVWCEAMMRQKRDIHVQNFAMYTFGLATNLL